MSERPIMILQRGGLTEAPTVAGAAAETPTATALADWLQAFWQLDREWPFTAPETRLYCYWLHTFHAARWPTLLVAREQLVAAHVNMSPKVFESAWVGLVDRGLLIYEGSDEGRAPAWGLPKLWPSPPASPTALPH